MKAPPTQYLMRAILSILNTEEPLVVCPTEEYEDIYWCDVPEDIRPSKKEVLQEIDRLRKIDQSQQYILNRVKQYPSIGDQLDILYHEGYDAWKEVIKEVKDRYPKP